ncbi:hypothetical protein HPP92_014926 [Vanilla planifolia]|uniref:RING-type domain-containing protein n=1 Tax=Vanilla planifolia TaxID=51239 RepID=A0A835QNJ7_VANPL|nr:hypothetical protein HPP92_014926 [Vanilla planifolia]
MAVQAQYPANVFLLNRAEPERNGKDADFPPAFLLEQSPLFFPATAGNVNPRKRGRDAVSPAMGLPMAVAPLPPRPPRQQQQMGIFSLQSQAMQPPLMTGVVQFSSQTPPVVSTGLCLALDEKNESQQPGSLSTFFSESLGAQINQQNDEIEQFLLVQGEHLRRSLVEWRLRHFRTLVIAAEEYTSKKLRQKEEEIQLAARRSAELEERLDCLRKESMALQVKAIAEQSTAAKLHAKLQQVTAAAAAVPSSEDRCGESPAEDAESAYVDPERTPPSERACRSCHRHPATVVLIPCRHLCLCTACDTASAGDGCPVCGFARSGSLHVFLS